MADVKKLFNEAVEHVTADNWINAINHVKKEEEKMWETDRVMEIMVEPLIINFESDSTTSDYESE